MQRVNFKRHIRRKGSYSIVALMLILIVCTLSSYGIGFFTLFSPWPKQLSKPVACMDRGNATVRFMGTKILYVMIALGKDSERNSMVKRNLELVISYRRRPNPKYTIDCILFAYAPFNQQPQWARNMLHDPGADCRVITMVKMKMFQYMKVLEPRMLRAAGYQYLLVNMDDVLLTPPESTFDFDMYLDMVLASDLSIATPAIINTPHFELRPKPIDGRAIGRLVSAIEIQSTLIRVDAWDCMWELVDTEYLSGWGVDIWYHEYCVKSGKVQNSRLGVLDVQTCVHSSLPTSNNVTVDLGTSNGFLFEEQKLRWKELRGVELVDSMPVTLGTIDCPFALLDDPFAI